MNDDALLEVPSPLEHGFAPLGEVLLAARKAKKLSAQDVSNNLRLSLKQISDIENNDFSTLPQPMITRGFIRNYARLLEIDAEPLLDNYRARMPEKTPKSLAVQSSMNQVVSGKESQHWLKYILGSILILLFLLAWIFYIDYMPKTAKPVKEKTPEAVAVSSSTTELTLPEVALPAAERQTDPAEVVTGTENGSTVTSAVTLPPESSNTNNPPTANVSPTSNASASNASTNNPSTSSTGNANSAANNAQAKPAESGKPTTPASPSSNAVVTAPTSTAAPKANTAIDFNTLKEKAGQNAATTNKTQVSQGPSTDNAGTVPVQKVHVSITEKTWIQATDKSGKVVYERILPAGSTDGFDGQPPFNIIIGNAKATKLSFLGKPVDLASSTTQNNVARIKLE